jgi:hypothetical protein
MVRDPAIFDVYLEKKIPLFPLARIVANEMFSSKNQPSRILAYICVSLKTTAELLTRKIFQNISDKN